MDELYSLTFSKLYLSGDIPIYFKLYMLHLTQYLINLFESMRNVWLWYMAMEDSLLLDGTIAVSSTTTNLTEAQNINGVGNIGNHKNNNDYKEVKVDT